VEDVVSYESRKTETIALLNRARTAGLDASADVVVGEVKRGLEGGFTSGDFDTGESVENVRKTAVTESPDGASVRVGTELIHNLLWEIGHLNVFSKQFERKEVWLPSLLSTSAEQLAAFTTAHKKVMGA
jgi:hypothetical protein